MNPRTFITKLTKFLAYLGAALVILLAIAVGLFRLLLPRLPEYQEEIKAWANTAIGMQVEFTDMDARWRLSGPELSFTNAQLTLPLQSAALLEVGEVSVGVSLLRLLKDRLLVVDRIEISDSKITLSHDEENGWIVQGLPIDEVIGKRRVDAGSAGDMLIVAKNIAIDLQPRQGIDSIPLVVDSIEVSRQDQRLKVDALLDLPDSLGTTLTLAASQYSPDGIAGAWQLFVEGKRLLLPAIIRSLPADLPRLDAGVLDISASMQLSPAGLHVATADFVVTNVVGVSSDPFASVDAQGRLEYSSDDAGWMLAASNVVLSTMNGVWPRSSISLQVARQIGEPATGSSISANYLNLDDLPYFVNLIPVDSREKIEKFAPSGVLRDLRASVEGLRTDHPGFDVVASLEEAGVAASGDWPGVRGFSGLLRANNDGGRLEIDSAGAVLDLTAYLPETIAFDDARGTVIWRSNAAGTTVLSDSIRIRNADLDSDTSLQVTLKADGQSPVVDIQSRWSVNDISAVKRYLPSRFIKPRVYEWLSEALVAGVAPAGSLQLSGPLDKFPFDQGEGVFRAEARLENTTLRYSDLWPDARNMSLDVVVEGMHLYSNRNSANNAGNTVVDAKIDIPNLRQPVLNIDAFATGSLETIRNFSRQSPIAAVFGGHLDQMIVNGDASFRLQLSLPILERDSYEFTTRVQASDGSMRFEGFPPALTGLNGYVTVTRDRVSSEGLFAQFLGEPVNIELNSADEDAPEVSVIAAVTGKLTDAGLFAELAPELEGFVSGSADYQASILFPKAGLEPPAVLYMVIQSDLQGMQIRLPDPLAKAGDELLPLEFTLEFPTAGRIGTRGNLSEELRWEMSFFREAETGWGLDRGVLALGAGRHPAAEFSGLHIVGETDVVVFDDWLQLSRNATGQGNVLAALRSIDLTVGDLYIIGQDFRDHRITLQRSAQDWLVTASGEQAQGNISIPYDFGSGRPMVLDMDTLVLPGDDSQREDDGRPQADPRALPPISIKAGSFGLGSRYFGALTAELERTPRGLETTLLMTRDDSFSVDGSVGWIVDNDDPLGQRSFLNARLHSNDILQTMNRLDYRPGIAGDEMTVNLDLGWSGGPDRDFLQRLSGKVALNIGSGQLDEVDPGAGRVFGLLSIVALPRRLSLDFKDVFEKGFGFDNITGTFVIRNGDAFTCDLFLEAPAADVGIVGRAGLVSRDYEQGAVVSASFGNSLPVLGGLVAGPQVAAALLIFSQIFKKPLQEASQVYYSIDGSWDAPNIVSRRDEDFAAISGNAGCIKTGK